MSIAYQIVPCERAHILALGTNLRPGDAAELAAAGISPERALWRSWRRSTFANAALVEGDVAAAWGLDGSPLRSVGEPWLLTAPPIERAKRAFISEARGAVAMMLAICPELRGKVVASYAQAVRFLEALGFTLSAPFPFGPRGALFREYRMVRG